MTVALGTSGYVHCYLRMAANGQNILQNSTLLLALVNEKNDANNEQLKCDSIAC
jgi:hypothetical protein